MGDIDENTVCALGNTGPLLPLLYVFFWNYVLLTIDCTGDRHLFLLMISAGLKTFSLRLSLCKMTSWGNFLIVFFWFQTKENLGKRILRKTFSNGEKDVPFWLKIQLLWTAPITKFWTAQAFYFIYLAIFCLATLWPTCGNFYLDLVLWSWTAVILMELVFRVYMKYKVSNYVIP